MDRSEGQAIFRAQSLKEKAVQIQHGIRKHTLWPPNQRRSSYNKSDSNYRLLEGQGTVNPNITIITFGIFTKQLRLRKSVSLMGGKN